MSAKRPFIEPRIVADTDLDIASQGFPLMPLVGGSGPILTGDSVTDGPAGDLFDGLTPNGVD